MRRPTLLARVLLPLAVVVALPVVAGPVYTWKDARGVTHYADAPPAGRKATTRVFGERPAAPVARAVANSDCSNARANLNLLQGEGNVGVDTDKDGKPDRELTVAERASRLKVAQGQFELYCDQPIATAATTPKS